MKSKHFSILMLILTAIVLLFILASCSPKISLYKVKKVNGQRFSVEGKRGVFIAPKDSVIVEGQMVLVKHIF